MTVRRPNRRGSVIPLLAVSIVALFAFVALAIDLGMMMVSRTECQNAADAAALAGVRTLDNNVPSGTNPDAYDNAKPQAEINARTAVTSNIFLSTNFTDTRVQTLRVGVYDYNTTTLQFASTYPDVKPTGKAWSSVEVIVDGEQPTYFGRVIGITSMPMTARSVAVHRPRDIAMVLDFTGSMGYSSIFNTSLLLGGQGVYNSPDPAYPQFGHYARYLAYHTANMAGSQTGAVGSRPNPLYQTGTQVSSPYVVSPGNFTVTTDNGPPILPDFRWDPAATGANVTTSNLANAFTAPTFSATARTADLGATPAPENFKNQTDTPTAFVGDKWPRKRGYIAPAAGADWDVTTANGAAINAAELLGWSANYVSGVALPSLGFATAPGRTDTNFRDAAWERHGYDLDIADYVTNRPADWDPRWDWDPGSGGGAWTHNRITSPSSSWKPKAKTSGLFQGFTMGPGYWGKTFFVWPPDPRSDKDWRRKFFLKDDNSAFATQGTTAQVDADINTSGNQTINGALLTDGTGRTMTAVGGNYQVNYSAVLAWIKSGPQVFPANLRAGRIRFYTSIPSDVDFNTGTADQVMDKRFWKAYIDFVVSGTGSLLAGDEAVGWPEGVTPDVLASAELTGYDPPDTVAPANQIDPRPYMQYKDNPSRPRMHLWFGPISMMGFLDWKNLYPGTCHQAQCWQLKTGVNSALDDIRSNHPNDLVGMTYFSHNESNPNPSQSYGAVMVPIGQDWVNLKNALFFPRTLLPQLAAGSTTAEVRPYNTSLTYTGWTDVPNAQHSTDPATGLAMAFNVLAPSSYTSADPARRGRRGASKIIIFETDGVPNAAQQVTFNARGYESYYTHNGGNDPAYPNNADADDAAFAIVRQIRKTMTTGNAAGTDSGLSLPSAHALVYSIGFGDIFSTSAGPAAAAFLLEIQKLGGTSLATDTAIPSYQIITGSYQMRIDNLRTALERILQSGVQVTLIE